MSWTAQRLRELLDGECAHMCAHMGCDMHVHSSYSSDVPDVLSQRPLNRLLSALERGMYYFVLTDHDTMAGYVQLMDELSMMGEVGKLAAERVISGVELSCRCPEVGIVHTNVFGLDERQFAHIDRLRDAGGFVRLERLMPYLDAEGLVCSLNHPLWQPPDGNITFSKVVRGVLTTLLNRRLHNGEAISQKIVESLYSPEGQRRMEEVYRGTLDIAGQFSLIEVNGSRVALMNDIAEHIASEVGVPTCGGSDDHYGEVLGLCYTIADGKDKWEFLERVEKGMGQVMRRDADFATSCMRFINFIRLVAESEEPEEVVVSLFNSQIGRLPLLIAPRFIRLMYRLLNRRNKRAQRAVEIMATSYLKAQDLRGGRGTS